jgi:D-glycero-D-manno-heptose 1,7-bisphosphate phosphatase
MNKALFLDRDGVINIDYGHVNKIEEFNFIEGIFELCRFFQDRGFIIIVITNQAGIGKGYYTEQDFLRLNDWMIKEFEKQRILITKTYYCPHKPEEKCECRKPNPGMFSKAIIDFDINPLISVSIGDKCSDIKASEEAGITTNILISGNTLYEILNSLRINSTLFEG